MFEFFLASFAFFLNLFQGRPLPAKNPITVKRNIISSTQPTKFIIIPTKKTITLNPTPTLPPTAQITPTPIISVSTSQPQPTSIPTVVQNKDPEFQPWSKSLILRPGSGNCSENTSGYAEVTITAYNPKDNITDYTIKGSVKNLNPNTKYVVELGSSRPLGGPSIVTDEYGYASFDFQGGYSVNYKEIYSITITDPNKLYPEDACLLGDLKDGLG